MVSTDFEKDLCALLDCGPLKAWSVVVTILGDLIQHPQGSVSGQILGGLVAPMGISNQTLRVALHRLKRDGWIRTEKTGRRTQYFLSEMGWRITQVARPMIYSSGPIAKRPVFLVAAEPSATLAEFAETMPEDAAYLSPRLVLTLEPETGFNASHLVLPLSMETLPEWVKTSVADQVQCNEYAHFTDLISSILGRSLPAQLVERSVLRLLILHHWRRLRLRHGALPDLLLSDNWQGARARAVTMCALNALERPATNALSQALNEATP